MLVSDSAAVLQPRGRAREEVVAIVVSEELRAALEAYTDEVPTAEAEEALRHYESRGTKVIGRLVARIREELSLKQG